MKFYEGHVYHIFNQGNNRNKTFLTEANYQFFLWQMKKYLLPYGDFITYCLMPNHFHWQFLVKKVDVDIATLKMHYNKMELLRRQKKYGPGAIPPMPYTPNKVDFEQRRNLSIAIGLTQRTYAQAFNRLNARSGSVFRQGCKAKTKFDIRDFSGLNSEALRNFDLNSERDYTTICFYYIHENPVKAGFVNHSTLWKYSSAREYAGLSKDNLCNVELGRQFVRID